MTPKPKPASQAPLLKTLRSVIEEHRPRTARYYGKANIDVLRLLVDSFARGAVQAMGCGGMVTDEQYIELQHRGVVWWDEGGEPAEMDVRDVGWPRDLLQKIVNFQRLRAARIWVLAGKAAKADLPDDYDWKKVGRIVVGVRMQRHDDVWADAERMRHGRITLTRAALRGKGYSVPYDPPDPHPGKPKGKPKNEIPDGTPVVTCEYWKTLPAAERERRERGATLMKASHSAIPFYAERAAKWGGDKYWAEQFDRFEE